MNTHEIINTLSTEITEVLRNVNTEEIDQAAELISQADHIFIQGNGRSGLVGKMAAMRLMHSGYHIHVVGETTTPSFTENDLLIVLSGSGKGSSLEKMIAKVNALGGKTLLVTATDDKAVTSNFDSAICIKASTKHNDIQTIQPLGNQFDQSMHIILDALIIKLNMQTGTTNADLKQKHFNLE